MSNNYIPIPPFYPFKNWVCNNFPFIEETFDGITNYQLMSKIVGYLNLIKGKTNELGEQVQALQNWFDNLDVQDEINNKLDEMAEDGTLDEMITAYINLKSMLVFNTVANMKEATNLVNGSYVQTLGYNSVNDNGASMYKIRNVTNEDVVDDGSIIALNDENLVAELIIENNTIKPEQFGCYGNGITDDTSKFKKALNFAIENKYKLIGIKDYVINETLTIYSNNYFELNIRKIKNTTNINLLLDISDNYNSIIIDDIETSASSTTAIKLSGIHGNGCRYNRIKIKNIYGFGIGLLMYGQGNMGTCYNTIDLGKIECNIGIQLQNHTTTDYVNSNYFYNATLDCSDICIKTISIENGNDFDGNSFNNISIVHYTTGIDLNNAKNNLFYNIRNLEIPTNSKVIITDNLSDYNQFIFNSYLRITDYNILGNVNYITGGIRSANSSIIYSNNTCFISNNKIFSFDNIRTPSGNTFGKWNSNYDMSEIYQFDPNMVVQFGGNDNQSYSLKLSSECNIISQFYINKLGTNSINIINADNTNIATGITETGLYLAKYDGTKWIVIKL